MANEKSGYAVAIIIIVIVAFVFIVLPLLLSMWFEEAPPSPVTTPIVSPAIVEQLPPLEPRREDTTLGAVSTPSVVDKIAPSVQPEIPAPLTPPPPPALRAEVVEVKGKVEETSEDLSKTIEQFRKEADELDLGE